MKKYLFVILVFVTTGMRAQSYMGPIAQPVAGYGAWGNSVVDSVEFYNAANATDTSVIYYPQGLSTSVPTVFFLHGLNGETPAYCRRVLHFIASKGFACVFIPHDGVNAVMDYAQMYIGFTEAARSYPNIIDTTRVGLVGHSFGGSACYYIGHDLFTNLNWGTNGRFLMPIASHYTLLISEAQLQTFPANTHLLSIVYEGDTVCDHRMTIEAFNHIAIPPADKDIVVVRSSQHQSYTYSAEHTAFNTLTYDALDVYVVFRLLDAMMDFVFSQNASAKVFCLGDGSAQQTSMPIGLQNLIAGDTITPWHAEAYYGYPCSVPMNPRYMYCGITTTLTAEESSAAIITQYDAFIYIRNVKLGTAYYLINSSGQIIAENQTSANTVEIPTANLAAGIYFVRCGDMTYRFVK